jgi:hypothetical protein
VMEGEKAGGRGEMEWSDGRRERVSRQSRKQSQVPSGLSPLYNLDAYYAFWLVAKEKPLQWRGKPKLPLP